MSSSSAPLSTRVAETAPEEMLAALTAFLAPYRNASARRNAVAADSRVLR
jgi:hypothetical protein